MQLLVQESFLCSWPTEIGAPGSRRRGGGNYWPDERSFSSTRLGILTERAKLTCFQILRIFSLQNWTKYQIWDKIFDILEITIVSNQNDWQGCEVSKNWHFYSETAFAVISITILHSPNHHRQTVQRWWKDHFLGGVMFPRPLWNQCVITSVIISIEEVTILECRTISWE